MNDRGNFGTYDGPATDDGNTDLVYTADTSN